MTPEQRRVAYQAALNQALDALAVQYGYVLKPSLAIDAEGPLATMRAILEAIQIPNWQAQNIEDDNGIS